MQTKKNPTPKIESVEKKGEKERKRKIYRNYFPLHTNKYEQF